MAPSEQSPRLPSLLAPSFPDGWSRSACLPLTALYWPPPTLLMTCLFSDSSKRGSAITEIMPRNQTCLSDESRTECVTPRGIDAFSGPRQGGADRVRPVPNRQLVYASVVGVCLTSYSCCICPAPVSTSSVAAPLSTTAPSSTILASSGTLTNADALRYDSPVDPIHFVCVGVGAGPCSLRVEPPLQVLPGVEIDAQVLPTSVVNS